MQDIPRYIAQASTIGKHRTTVEDAISESLILQLFATDTAEGLVAPGGERSK